MTGRGFSDKRGVNRFATLLGMELESTGAGTSVCTLDIHDDLFHAGGMVHGGAAYSLVDTGMASATMSTLDSGEATATIEIKISYLEAVRKGRMRCESRVVRRGKRVAFLESEVREGDRLIATATGTFAIMGDRK